MRKKKRSKKTPNFNNRLIMTILVIVVVVFAGKILLQKQTPQSSNVLGLLLAKGDDDSGGSSGDGSSGSGNNDSGGLGSGSSDSGSSSGSSDSSSSSGSGSSDSGSSGSFGSTSGADGTGEDSNSSGSSGGSNITPTQTRIVNPTTGIRTETEIRQAEERTEIRLSEDERIRTRIKEGRTRIDITSGGVRTRFEIRDDRIVIKAEQEDGTEVELEDDTIFKIEERLATDQIKVATDEAGRIVIQRGSIGAVSEFPLSIDLATNTLIVTTPSGAKNVTVLPDQAVQNLLVANVVNRLGAGIVVSSVRSGEVSALDQVVTLGEQNGVPIYEINGISDQRLLGFFPVAIEKTVGVSAETGDVVSTQISFVNQVLDLLSS